MMRAMLAIAIVFLALSFDLRPAAAQYAPWCAVIGMGEDAVYGDCHYRTFEECCPNVLAGNRGFCNQNPRYDRRGGRSLARAASATPASINRPKLAVVAMGRSYWL